MTSEIDNLTESIFPDRRELSNQNPQEVRQQVNWAKKQTINIDSVKNGNLLKFLQKHSVVVAGKTISSDEDVSIQLPTISTNSPQRAGEVRVIASKLRRNSIHNASVQGFISLDTAESILDRIDSGLEPLPEITFQDTPGLRRERQKANNEARTAAREAIRTDKKVSRSSGFLAPAPLVYEIPREKKSKAYKKYKDVIKVGGIAFLTGACSVVPATSVVTPDTMPLSTEMFNMSTSTPFQPETPTSTAILERIQTLTLEPTGTPTQEAYDWNYVNQRSDEQLFADIGVPNPDDYSLNVELSAYKILRNEAGQSYALFQNPEGIVLLAQNLETRKIEHAIYTEYEGGVPLLLLTDQGVVEKDGGWFKLNESYPASDAQARLARAFNRALAMRWWGFNHQNAGSLPYGIKNWLDEIPGFHAMEFISLTRNERTQISDYIMQRFLETLQDTRANNLSLPIELADRNRVEFDAANETLIIKAVLSENTSWVPIFEHFMDFTHREVTSERNGSFLTLYFSQPDFLPVREPRPVGGTITHFLRYFFGASYFYQTTSINARRSEFDMTGPILEDLCNSGSIPDSTLYFYSNIYPALNYDDSYTSPTNTCSVVFSR